MNIVHYPLSTEKAMKLMEAENTLVFIVEKKTTKKEIKEEIEKTFNVKIRKINTNIDRKGRKKAYVRLSEESPAIDLATKLGLM